MRLLGMDKLAINPAILAWARTTAGLSLEDAAHSIGLKEAYGLTSAERLTALEAGAEQVTRPLLLKMAKAYRRSLLVFYLPARRLQAGLPYRPRSVPPQYDPDWDAMLRQPSWCSPVGAAQLAAPSSPVGSWCDCSWCQA